MRAGGLFEGLGYAQPLNWLRSVPDCGRQVDAGDARTSPRPPPHPITPLPFDQTPQQLSTGLTLVMLDLDHFKQFNDTQGHAAGDHLLKQFGALLKKSSRPNDSLARIGGEECVLALPRGPVKAAEPLILRLRSSPELIIGFSAGIAEVKIGERVCDALARADRALYRAKHLGRSRTCLDLQSPSIEPQISMSAQIV